LYDFSAVSGRQPRAAASIAAGGEGIGREDTNAREIGVFGE
jgi:hypothetical protein